MYLGVSFLFVSTPSPCGHSPYILLRKTQGGESEMYIPFSSAVSRSIARYFFSLSEIFKTPPLCGAGHRGSVT